MARATAAKSCSNINIRIRQTSPTGSSTEPCRIIIIICVSTSCGEHKPYVHTHVCGTLLHPYYTCMCMFLKKHIYCDDDNFNESTKPQEQSGAAKAPRWHARRCIINSLHDFTATSPRQGKVSVFLEKGETGVFFWRAGRGTRLGYFNTSKYQCIVQKRPVCRFRLPESRK